MIESTVGWMDPKQSVISGGGESSGETPEVSAVGAPMGLESCGSILTGVEGISVFYQLSQCGWVESWLWVEGCQSLLCAMSVRL